MAFKVTDDGRFTGEVRFSNVLLNDDCVGDDQMDPNDVPQAGHLQHQHRVIHAQESATAVSSETKVVHVVHGTTGIIKEFKAGCVTDCTTGTIDVDLLKNGSTVMTTDIELAAADGDYALVSGTIDAAKDDLAQEDVLEIAITDNSADGKGVFAYVDIYEDAT